MGMDRQVQDNLIIINAIEAPVFKDIEWAIKFVEDLNNQGFQKIAILVENQDYANKYKQHFSDNILLLLKQSDLQLAGKIIDKNTSNLCATDLKQLAPYIIAIDQAKQHFGINERDKILLLDHNKSNKALLKELSFLCMAMVRFSFFNLSPDKTSRKTLRNEVKSIAKLFYKESDNIESVLTPTPGNTEFSYSKSAEDNSPDTVVIEPSFSKIYRPAPQSRKYAIHKRVGSYKWEPPLSMTSPPFTTSTAISNSSTKISSQQLHEDRIPPALDYTINSNNLGSLDTGDSPHMNPKVACTHSYTISESIEVKQSQQDSILPSSAIYNPLVEYIKKYNAKFNDIFKTLNAYKNFIAQLPDKTLAEQSINEFINNKLPLDLQSLILQVDNGRKVYGPESLIAKLHEKIYTMNSKLEYFKQFYSFMDSENYIERLLLKVEKVVSLIRISPAISGIFYILLSEESKEASQPMPASYKKLQMRKK